MRLPGTSGTILNISQHTATVICNCTALVPLELWLMKEGDNINLKINDETEKSG